MIKFILKTLGFFFIIISIFFLLLGAIYLKSPENYENDYYGAKTNKANKIILVGSSNVYTNYNYVALNEAFQQYDVIGSNYPLTVGFMPLIAKLNLLDVQKDDIVVFCLPYELYDNNNFIDFFNEHPQKVLTKQTIREAFRYNAYQTTLNFMKFNPKGYYFYLSKKIEDSIDANHLVHMNAQQKDLVSIKEYTSCIVSPEDNFFVTSMEFDEAYLKTFKEVIQKKLNCKVYFRFPPLRTDNYDINLKKIDYLETNYKFTNDFEKSIFESKYWYNWRYHLNKCGADLNTSNFITEIQNVIESN